MTESDTTTLSPDNHKATTSEKLETRLLLVCHAEGLNDRYAQFGGENSGLTAHGWEQADILAGWLLRNESVDVLVSDSLLQSRLTAQRIGQALGLSVTVNRDLPNCPRDLLKSLTLNGSNSALGQGDVPAPADSLKEPYATFHKGLVAALDKLMAEHRGSTVLLVTCGDTISTLLRHLFGAHRAEVRIDHTSVTEVLLSSERCSIEYVNRHEYLPTPAAAARPAAEESPTAEPIEDLSAIVKVYNRVAEANLEQKREDDRKRARHLLNFVKIPPDSRVLDIGTGLGILPMIAAEDGASAVIGIDISPSMLEQAEFYRLSKYTPSAAKVSFRLAPAQALPFAADSMDVVMCRLVLNHARKPERIIKEIVRVLKPGGMLILAELVSGDNPVKRATQNAIEERRNPSHVAARSVEQYNKMLTDAGLIIEAREVVMFDRELEEWLAAYALDRAEAAAVREMIEAGLETDAAGINARHQGNTLVFEQRVYYLRATKPEEKPPATST